MRRSVERERRAARASSQVATMLGGGATGTSISSFWTRGGGTAVGAGGIAGATGAAVGWADAAFASARIRVARRTMGRRHMGPSMQDGRPPCKRIDLERAVGALLPARGRLRCSGALAGLRPGRRRAPLGRRFGVGSPLLEPAP